MSNHKILAALALSLAAAASLAQPAAPVTVDGAWARASVQGQKGTGAFMALTAREPLSLVGASSPAAGIAEVHEMKMDGDVMRMRPAGSIALAPGKVLELKPGGYHLMLMELKAPLKPGTTVPVSLLFKTAGGETRKLDLAVPVVVMAPQAGHKH
ncbi:copper chaperone PCu(A)C [Ramlibacter sp.]|uniref:copper chaperone PCu(A)C n=1 Tax=Ramlibacter sp. TaxID=1917967 RepID=UPI00184BE15B|nr:copper chaperone PCu(A)C [Ramlibacter sp.]MBA2672656.1 copper chaperone PCu(A)C [Ramlibacter sp.]